MNIIKLSALLFFFTVLISCDKQNTESSANQNVQELTKVKKYDACEVISASELALIINGEIIEPDEKGVLLSETEYDHYISLCNFYHSDNVITIRIAQKKKTRDPQKSRDSYLNIQKGDEDVTLIESVDIKGVPANYFEMHVKSFDIKNNTLILFTNEFEVSVISDFMNKEQLVKASEKILENLKK